MADAGNGLPGVGVAVDLGDAEAAHPGAGPFVAVHEDVDVLSGERLEVLDLDLQFALRAL